MNELRISTILERDPVSRRRFGGVLAANELPRIVGQRPRVYVVNTDVRGLPGTHWTIFYFPRRGPAEFFDSMGHSPDYYHRQFKRFLIKHGPTYVYNRRRIQPYGTDTCGRYCIAFAKLRCRGWTMKRIVPYLKFRLYSL